MSRNFNKKAQGLSLSTVIIAIIVLVVLVVLVMVFTGGIQKFFVTGVKQCEASGGACSDKCDTASGDKIIDTYTAADGSDAKNAGCSNADANAYCCRKALI